VSVTLPATVADVVRRVRQELPGARHLPERPLAAVNLKHVKLDASVGDGDEVALLPPVAGG
jgi:molybdopterin converting factor small subunit